MDCLIHNRIQAFMGYEDRMNAEQYLMRAFRAAVKVRDLMQRHIEMQVSSKDNGKKYEIGKKSQ